MRTLPARLRFAFRLALLAWLAQLCLPAVHASAMAAQRADLLGWCGEPSLALAVASALPDEIREGLGLDSASADHLAGCDALCASGAAPPVPAVANTVVLRAAGHERAPAERPAPRSRERAPRPPSQAPPALA